MKRRTSRAAVIVEHKAPPVIQEVPIPPLEPGALLVRILSSTLCGTDVHRWHGPLDSSRDSLPIITGHEPCGIIEEISGQRTDILGGSSASG
jgi:L-iditol 2-dehydrogenase